MAEGQIRQVALPEVLYRIAVRHRGLAFSEITPEDHANPRAGHRFDVLGAGVLYAATRPRAAYLETLGNLRPSPGVELAPADDDSEFMKPGSIPQQWREDRAMFELSASAESAMTFVDLTDVGTRTWLAGILRDQLKLLDIDYLDVPEVTNKNRYITRMLAGALYTVRSEQHEDEFAFGGLRYASRYDSNEECWAVFDRFPLEIAQQHRIDCYDELYRDTAAALGLTPF